MPVGWYCTVCRKADRHAGAVAEDDPVGGGAVVVGGHEALDVQAAAAAGGHDHRLGLDHEVLLGLQVVEHRAGAVAVLVEHQLDGR